MSKKIKCILTILVSVMLAAAQYLPALAQSSEFSGSCEFDGKNINSDFKTGKIAETVTDMEPGDSASFTVKYTNNSSDKTDWYMSNKVIQTLEKANSSKKGVTSPGTGQAENGGYTYELIHTDKDNKQTVLFSNREVGGDARPGNMQGLEQATNALDDWFYIQTIGKGESGSVTLNIELEGETQANDYMDTEGELELRFAVELTKDGTVAPPGEKTPDKELKTKTVYKTKSGNGVRTGDTNHPGMWVSIMAFSGLTLLVLAIISIRRDRKEAASSEND
jgi:hypothetical protein